MLSVTLVPPLKPGALADFEGRASERLHWASTPLAPTLTLLDFKFAALHVINFEVLGAQAGAMRRLVAENKEKYPRTG